MRYEKISEITLGHTGANSKACGKKTARVRMASPDIDEDDIEDNQEPEASEDDDVFKMNSKDDEEVEDEESDTIEMEDESDELLIDVSSSNQS
jgi:hypothetical protein